MTSFEIKRARGKTAVFSGVRQHSDHVPKLEDLCIQKLLNNVNRIECVGDVPYYILKPLLTKVSVSQLKRIESFNPLISKTATNKTPPRMITIIIITNETNRQQYRLFGAQQLVDDDDSDEPWKAHCQRYFEGRLARPGESWRELYARCERERDHKIERIAKKIKKDEQKALPVRQTRVVDQQLPGGKSRAVSSTTVITKTIKNHIPSRNPSSLAAGRQPSTSTVVIRRETCDKNGSSSGLKGKPKTAPLMQKSMALFKSRFRR